MENNLVEFTCQGSGKKLKIRHVSFLLTDLIGDKYEQEHKRPEPPKVTVKYGDQEEVEDNPADPKYVAKLQKWLAARADWVNAQGMKLYTEEAIVCDVDTEAVKALRERMEKYGIKLDENDKYVYIWNICVSTFEDQRELIHAIQYRSFPTQEAVDKAKASFPS